MAKDWRFWARWGSSCGRTFDANEFLREHPQYSRLEGFLPDLTAQPWTVLPANK
jgi:hypothetical protein